MIQNVRTIYTLGTHTESLVTQKGVKEARFLKIQQVIMNAYCVKHIYKQKGIHQSIGLQGA